MHLRHLENMCSAPSSLCLTFVWTRVFDCMYVYIVIHCYSYNYNIWQFNSSNTYAYIDTSIHIRPLSNPSSYRFLLHHAHIFFNCTEAPWRWGSRGRCPHDEAAGGAGFVAHDEGVASLTVSSSAGAWPVGNAAGPSDKSGEQGSNVNSVAYVRPSSCLG